MFSSILQTNCRKQIFGKRDHDKQKNVSVYFIYKKPVKKIIQLLSKLKNIAQFTVKYRVYLHIKINVQNC